MNNFHGSALPHRRQDGLHTLCNAPQCANIRVTHLDITFPKKQQLGFNCADEMILTVPKVPSLGLISVFDVVSALIVTTQRCAVSRDSAVTA